MNDKEVKKNLSGLHNTLVSNGYDVPSLDQFSKDMRSEKNLREVYATLKREGYTPPDFEEFKGAMGWVRPKDAGVPIPLRPKDQEVRPLPKGISLGENPQGYDLPANPKLPATAPKARLGFPRLDKKTLRPIQEVQDPEAPIIKATRDIAKDDNGNIVNVVTPELVPDFDPEHGGVAAPKAFLDVRSGKPIRVRDFSKEEIEGINRGDFDAVQDPKIRKALKDSNFYYAPRLEEGDVRRTAKNLTEEIDQALKERAEFLSKSRGMSEKYDAPFFPGPNARIPMPTVEDIRKFDGDYDVLLVAKDTMRELNETIAEADRNSKTAQDFASWYEQSGLAGTLRGFKSTLSDERTWDHGVRDINNILALRRAVKKSDRGEKLSRGEQLLLDAKATEMAVGLYFEDRIGRGYKAGSVAAYAIPFMVDMAAGGGLITKGQSIGAGLARYAIRRFGIHVAKKVAIKAAIRGGSALVGATVGGFLMTNTFGAVRTIADVNRRMTGDVKMGVALDKEGNVTTTYGGHTKGDSLGTAILKAEVAGTAEYATEMLGDGLVGMVKWAGGKLAAPVASRLGKLFGKAGAEAVETGVKVSNPWSLARVGKMIDNIQASKFSAGLKSIEETAQWNGVFGEYIEEVANNLVSVAIGDKDLSTEKGKGLFNLDDNIDTFLGVGLMGGVMSAARTAGYFAGGGLRGAARYQMGVAGDRVDGLLTTGEQLSRWRDLRNQITVRSGAEQVEAIKEAMSDPTFNADQRRAILGYAKAVQEYRGARAFDEKAKEDPQQDPLQSQLGEFFDMGAAITEAEEMHRARGFYDLQREVTKERLGVDDKALDAMSQHDGLSLEQVQALRGEHGSTAVQSYVDYLNARARYEGMINGVRNGIQAEVSAVEQGLRSRQHRDGSLQRAKLRGEEGKEPSVYIKDGHLALTEEGQIDRGQSDRDFVVRDEETGEVRFVNIDDFHSAEAPVSAQMEIESQTATLRQSKAEEASAKISGTLPMQVGDQVPVLDQAGNPQQVTITGVAQDGSITVEQDGQPQQTTREELQARADEARASQIAREQQEKEQQDRLEEQEERAEAGLPRYALNDEVTLRTEDGEQVRGYIQAEENEDGMIEVWTEKPVSGRKINVFSRDQLDGMVVSTRLAPETNDGSAENQRTFSEKPSLVSEAPAEEPEEEDPRLGRPMTEEEADAFLDEISENPEVAPTLELTIENWDAEFGEDGLVETPLGTVHMGENQFVKLSREGRSGKLGMIRPTLERPDVIIKDTSQSEDEAERSHSYIFIKSVTQEGKERLYYFTSVSVSQDGQEVIVSNQEKRKNRVKTLLTAGEVLYLKPESLHPFAQVESSVSLNDSRAATQAENITAPHGIHSSEQASSEDKVSESPEETNPEDESLKPEEAYDAVLRVTESDAEMAQEVIRQKIEVARAKLTSAKKSKPRKAESVQAIAEALGEHKQKIQAAEESLAHWQAVAEVPAQRAQEEAQAKIKELAPNAQPLTQAEEASVPEWHNDNPESARDRGFVRIEGQRIDRQEELQDIALGAEEEVKFASHDSQPTRYALVDASKLQPSHRGGQQNPLHFIPEAQPKDRSDFVSDQAARKIAKDISPKEITLGVTAYTGAPTINLRGEVIQGNSRADALRLMWESHREQSGARYKQYLLEHAEELGLDPQAIEGMDSPVLVHLAEVSDQRAIELGQYRQSDIESGGVERISPPGLYGKLGDSREGFARNLLDTGDEEASLDALIVRNGPQTLKWLLSNGHITQTQYASAFDKGGSLTPEAKEDLRQTIYQSFFAGGYNGLQHDFEGLPKRAQKALLSTAYRDQQSPQDAHFLGALQEGVGAYQELMGYKPFAEARSFEQAEQALSDWLRLGADLSTGKVPAEMFTNFALRLALCYKFDSQRELSGKLKEVFDAVQNVAEEDLFAPEGQTQPKTLAEAVKAVFGVDYQPNTNTLQDNGTDGSSAPSGHSEASQSGSPRGSGTPASDEQGAPRAGQADSRGRAASDPQGGSVVSETTPASPEAEGEIQTQEAPGAEGRTPKAEVGVEAKEDPEARREEARKTLRQLQWDGKYEEEKHLARTTQDPYLIEAFINSVDSHIPAEIAQNPHLSESDVNRLVERMEQENGFALLNANAIIHGLSASGLITPALSDRLLPIAREERTGEALGSLAKSPGISSETEAELFKLAMERGRRGNPSIHAMGEGLAKNPATTPEHLRALAFDYGEKVAENPSTPEDLLRLFVEQERTPYGNHHALRHGVARNPSTPADLLLHIISTADPREQALIDAARNPNLQGESLEKAASMTSYAASNANATTAQLQAWAQQENSAIAYEAKQALKAREKEAAKETKQTDQQGNPINEDGTLKVEEVASIDEISDADFDTPSRNLLLPELPTAVGQALGAEGKRVVIKKNILARNKERHPEVSDEASRDILQAALYDPTLYGQNQKAKRPYNWVVVNTKDTEGNNRLVLLEISPKKEHLEVVHWHYVDERGLDKIRRQAQREDGQLLILPSEQSEEVGALSNPTQGLSSEDKGKEKADTEAIEVPYQPMSLEEIEEREKRDPLFSATSAEYHRKELAEWEKIQKLPQESPYTEEKTGVYDVTSKDKTRPELRGVYHDKSAKTAVATNGRILIAERGAYDPKKAGTIDDGKGKTIREKYPNWKSLVKGVSSSTYSGGWKVDELSSYLDDLEAKTYAYWREGQFESPSLRGSATYDEVRERTVVDLALHNGDVFSIPLGDARQLVAAAKRLGIDEIKMGKLDGESYNVLIGQNGGSTVMISAGRIAGGVKTGHVKGGHSSYREHVFESKDLVSAKEGLRDGVIETLRGAGIEVITDEAEGQAVLDAARGGEVREQRVYHGTSQDFDRFDHSKMGVGTGQQTLGWGTYVTQSKDIATHYATYQRGHFTPSEQSPLSNKGDALKLGNYITQKRKAAEAQARLAEAQAQGTAEEIAEAQASLEAAQERVAGLEQTYPKSLLDKEEAFKAWQERRDAEKARWEESRDNWPATVMSVEIPDEGTHRYLDYDQPVSAEEVDRINTELKARGFDEIDTSQEYTGRNFYNAVTNAVGTDKDASLFLHEAGYTGVVYDASELSSKEGEKTGARNYVIFDEGDLEIKDKIRLFKTSEGEVYGFVKGGKIYLDPKHATANTAIHEYTHLWVSALREANPKAWRDIVRLINKSLPLELLDVRSTYSELERDEDALAEEVLAHYAGRRGAQRLAEEYDRLYQEAPDVVSRARVRATFDNLRDALKRFWTEVADFLGITKYKSPEEVADKVLSDLLHGVNPNTAVEQKRKGQSTEKTEAKDQLSIYEKEATIAQAKEELEQMRSELSGLKQQALEAMRSHYDSGALPGMTESQFRDQARYVFVGSKNREGLALMSTPGLQEMLAPIDELAERVRYKDLQIRNSEKILAQEKGEAKRPDEQVRMQKEATTQSAEEAEIIAKAKADGSFMKAPNGKPSNLSERQWTQVRTQAFKDWFGDWEKNPKGASKVVDENGEPKVVYHYTSEEFHTFDLNQARPQSDVQGFFFSSGTEDWADMGDVVQPAFLNMRNPTSKPILDRSQNDAGVQARQNLLDAGYDGAIEEEEDMETEYLVLNPNQVKSATINAGTFDEKNDDIRFRSTESELSAVNDRFNEELQAQIDGTLPAGHVYQLGYPSEILRSAGIENLPIELTARRLAKKASTDYKSDHPFNLGDITNLPQAIASPIAVFASHTQPGSKVILTELQDSRSVNFVVALRVTKSEEFKSLDIDVNDIRSLYPKDRIGGILDWINQGDMLWVDREKALEWIDKRRSNSAEVADRSKSLSDATKVVETFDNPRTESEKTELAGVATETSEALGEGVRVIHDVSEIEGRNESETRQMRGAKGWYDPKTGEVVVVLPNAESAEDVQATILHEVVGHKGLQEVVGRDRFDGFLDHVFEGVSSGVRDGIIQRSKSHGWNTRLATEEYIAELAERGFDDLEARNVWHVIRNAFLGMLSRAKIALGWDINDRDLRYMLWRTYQAKKGEGLVGKAKDVAMQSKLGVGRFGGKRFREGVKPVSVAQAYDERIRESGFQAQEALQDSMLSLKDTMEMIKAAQGDAKYVEEIDGFENPYLGENRVSSVNQAESALYERAVLEPLVEEVARLSEGTSREAVTDYMMAKHGLERNRVMAFQQAVNAQVEAYNKKAKEEGSKPISATDLWQDYLWDEERLDNEEAYRSGDIDVATWHAKDSELRAKYAPGYAKYRNRDYAGLTGLLGLEDASLQELETEALDQVQAFEESHDVSRLWSLTNRATVSTLVKQYEGGLMSKQTLDHVASMYNYYIPLRGFDEMTSEEAYSYIGSRDRAFSPTLKKAKGRSSKAEDPIAHISSMMESAILQSNRNKLVRMKFLNFVENNPSDLFSVSDVWVEWNAADQTWDAVLPEFDPSDSSEEVVRKTHEFEERMQALRSEHPELYKRASEDTAIPYRVVGDQKKRQHVVLVKRGGRDVMVTVNGDPRVAMAVNGLTNPDSDAGGHEGAFFRKIGDVNRWLAGMYTSHNPEFTATNFARDMIYANSVVWVKESPAYARGFHRNVARFNPVRLGQLIRLYNRGKLDENNEDHRLFYQFMINGGETGYSQLRDIEKHKRAIDRLVQETGGRLTVRQATDLLLKKLEDTNRAIENVSRMAAFVTSREMGRSIERAIYDAKEITVNFNKKGAGSTFADAHTQTGLGKTAAYTSGFGRSFYLFWNVAIQGTTNVARAIKRNPAKGAAWATTFLTLGAMMPLVASMAGGGDDDRYWDLPEYTRRNNLCFFVGDYLVKLPLPQEARAIYGLGEMGTSLYRGMEDTSDPVALTAAIAGQVSQIMPLDPIDDAGTLHALTPTLARPMAEVWANKSWTGQAIWKETDANRDMPSWTKAYKSTGSAYLWLAKTVNELSGGDDFRQGAVDINPSALEHLAKGYLGGPYTFFNKLVKTGETAVGEREAEMRNIPFLSRFMESADERNSQRSVGASYYRYKAEASEVRRLERSYQRAIDNAKPGDRDYREELDKLVNSPAYQRYEIFEELGQEIEAMQKELREIDDPQEAEKLQIIIDQQKKALVHELRGVK